MECLAVGEDALPARKVSSAVWWWTVCEVIRGSIVVINALCCNEIASV